LSKKAGNHADNGEESLGKIYLKGGLEMEIRQYGRIREQGRKG